MDSKSLLIGVIVGILIGTAVAYIVIPEKVHTEYLTVPGSGVSQEEYDRLDRKYAQLQTDYNSLLYGLDLADKEINVLENENADLQNVVNDLQTQLEKYLPTETGEVGRSRYNPAPIGTELYLEFTMGDEGGYSCEMNVTEVIRGEPALKKVIEADGYLRSLWYDVQKYENLTSKYLKDFGKDNVYYDNALDQLLSAQDRLDSNNPLDDGYEFLLVKVRFEFLTGPSSITLSAHDFKVISDSGVVYDVPYVEVPSPEFDIELLPRSNFEGWCVFEVLKDGEQPRLSFASHPDGTGGLWFNLFS